MDITSLMALQNSPLSNFVCVNKILTKERNGNDVCSRGDIGIKRTNIAALSF
jgi:hypothetical protein